MDLYFPVSIDTLLFRYLTKKALRALFIFSVIRFSLYALIKIYHFKDMINCLPLGFMIGTDQQLCDQTHQYRLKT